MHTWLTLCLSHFAWFCCPFNRKLAPTHVPASFLFCFIPVSSLAEVKPEGRHVCNVNNSVFPERKVISVCMSGGMCMSECSANVCETASVYLTSSNN